MAFPTGPLAAQPALPPAWFVALDLGQQADYSALAALKRSQPAAGRPAVYDIQYLRRYELGTAYTRIVEQVVAALNRPAKQNASARPLRGCVFGLDQTGVGRAVCDMFRAARPPCKLHGITITAGHQATHDSDGWRVPKKDLVAVVQVLLQNGRLKWDPRLPFADKLGKELADFSVRVTAAANEQFGVWREGAHDDLVLAVSIAAWLGERITPPSSTKPLMFGGMASVCVGPRPLGGSGGFHI